MQSPATCSHTHLVAVIDLDDQSEASISANPVIEQARRIVRRTRSALTLICFQSPPSLLSNLQSLVSGADPAGPQLPVRQALSELARQIEEEEGVGVRCEGLQVPFDPAVLEDWLRASPADLLLLPKPEQGSTATTTTYGLSQFIRQTGMPVWFVERGLRPQHGVVAAVSEGARTASDELRALDYEVVDTARGIGSLFSARFHLVQAVQAGIDDRSRALESFARATGVAEHAGEIVAKEGGVSSVLASSAETLQAGLIVMGASGKSRWDALVHGGEVESTLTRAPCDVLYVKMGAKTQARPQALLSHSVLESQPQPNEVDLFVHPRRHYATPLVVLRDEQRSWQSKVLILEAWEEELENEAVHEGKMPQQVYETTFDPDELKLVRQALVRLGARSSDLAA